MNLFAFVGAGLLAVGTMAAAPSDAQRHGHDGYGRGHGYGHAYGYGRGRGHAYAYGHYRRPYGWHHRRYVRCRYRHCY